MIYILIVVLGCTTFQEFSSKESCEAALQTLSNWNVVNGFDAPGKAWCQPK